MNEFDWKKLYFINLVHPSLANDWQGWASYFMRLIFKLSQCMIISRAYCKISPLHCDITHLGKPVNENNLSIILEMELKFSYATFNVSS